MDFCNMDLHIKPLYGYKNYKKLISALHCMPEISKIEQ